MARRKINLQDTGRKRADQGIDRLVQSMGTTDLGFSPTDQGIYEVELNKIWPDFSQSRHFLPFDLREKLSEQGMTPAEAIRELVKRAEQANQLAVLILGEYTDVLDEEEERPDEDRGLLALANSIKAVGLRQPINVYRIPNPDSPGESFYQIGEGERRYWAHHLLVLQGHEQFNKIRCVIETLPDDQTLIQRRQEAENAARQDLSAIARARSVKRIRNRLSLELGTRVPGQTTIKLPSQRELDAAVGQEVKAFTGRAISDRMVRNYMRLLNLPPGLQDLAEAAQLTEKQLRPVMRLKTEAEQLHMIKQIIDEKLSGRAVLARVSLALPATSLKRTTPTTLEQRLEKRLFQTAKTVHEVLTLGEESYTDIVRVLASKMSDQTTREALLALRRVINDLLDDAEADLPGGGQTIDLNLIRPPVDAVMSNLPENYQLQLNRDDLTGPAIIDMVLDWRRNDPLVASRLAKFFNQIEKLAEQIKAGEGITKPTLRRIREEDISGGFTYQFLNHKTIYWAHVWLISQGFSEFDTVVAEIVD